MNDNYVLPAVEDIKDLSKEQLLSDDVMLALIEEKDNILKRRYLNAIEERAKVLKITSMFKNTLKDFQDEQLRIQKANAQEELYNVDNYGTFRCGQWSISENDGITTWGIMGLITACPHVVLPVKRFTNLETNEEMVTLIYKRRGDEWRNITVKRSIIANAGKIVDALSSKGIAVTTENAKNLVKFLSDFENLNFERIPIQKSTSKMGWKNGSFIPFSDEGILFDGEAKFLSCYEALQPEGSFDDWVQHIKKIRSEGKFENMIYLVASFASVLIEPLDALPFILDIYGPSGRGKTVALMMACSVWANPKEGEFINGANSTMTALELKLNFLNHLPMFTDDMAQLKLYRQEDYSDFIYRVCSGRGKSRGNTSLSIDALTTWANITLTNAERPLTSDGMKGGAVNRIIDVQIGDEPMFADGNYEATFFKQNYGHAGRKFVEIIQSVGKDKLKELCQSFRKKIMTECELRDDQKEEKQVLPMAILLTADALIDEYIFQDGCTLDFERCFTAMKSCKEVSENERAWEYLIETIAMNSSKFLGGPSEPPANSPIWGKFEEDGARVFIIKKVLDEELAKGGFDSNFMIQWACKVGKAVPAKDGRPTKTKKLEMIPTRCAEIILEDTNAFIKVDPEEEEDLPFK